MNEQPSAGAVMRAMRAAALALLAAMSIVAAAFAQMKTGLPPAVPGAKPVTVEHIRVHSAAIAGNLEGESADRDVIVFLPPGYGQDMNRRYPVVYALHGFFIGAEEWTHEIHVPQTIEGAFARGSRPMIVVLPDSKTVYGGSMYSSSATTGDFERFIAHDLVAYIDAHYRTMPERRSRGPRRAFDGGYGAATASRTISTSIPARTPAPWHIAFRTACCRSSAGRGASRIAIGQEAQAQRAAGNLMRHRVVPCFHSCP